MIGRRRRLPVAPFALLGVLAFAPSVRADAVDDDPALSSALESVVAARAKAIVPVRAAMKISVLLNGQAVMEQERNAHIRACAVDPSGLLLTFDPQPLITGVVQALSAMMPNAKGIDAKMTPSKLVAIVGDEQKEMDAIEVVRDPDVGVEWLQIVDPPAGLATVDLSEGGTVRVGQPLVAASRLGRAFDFAPEALSTFVTRRVEKPRALWGLTAGAEAMGLPAFDLAGKPVGVMTIRIEPDAHIQLGSLAGLADAGGEFLVPLDAIRKSMAEAKKRVPDALAKAKAVKETPAKAPEAGKDAGPKKEGETSPTPKPDAPPAK